MAHLQGKGEGWEVHSLRKTPNDFSTRECVSCEAQCHFMDREIDHMNVAVCGKKFEPHELTKMVVPSQEKLLKLTTCLMLGKELRSADLIDLSHT